MENLLLNKYTNNILALTANSNPNTPITNWQMLCDENPKLIAYLNSHWIHDEFCPRHDGLTRDEVLSGTKMFFSQTPLNSSNTI